MAYITNADIEQRLGHVAYVQLTVDYGTGIADEVKIDEARLGAEGEVDSYLGRRYAVPINLALYPETAGVLKSITLDLAEYRLHCRRSPVPEEVIAKRELAVRWLQGIATGELVLPTTTEPASNPASGFEARVTGNLRILTPDEMKDL